MSTQAFSRLFLSLMFSCVTLAGYCNEPCSLLIFGDSLSDTGAGTTVCRSLGLPALPPTSHYYEGRYCNGPVWVDYLSQDLQLEYLNFSVGGSQTGEGQTLALFGYPLGGLFHQIDRFQAEHQQIQPETIVILEIGSNDFLSLLFEPSQLTPEGIAQRSQLAIQNIDVACQRLCDLGAKRIVVWNMPDLGRIPKFHRGAPLNNIAPLMSAAAIHFNIALNEFVEQFNASNNQMHLFYYDAHTAFSTIGDSLEEQGISLTSYAVAFWPHTPPTVEITGENAENLFFFDLDHPTTLVWRLFTNGFSQFIAALLPAEAWTESTTSTTLY